MSKAKIVFNMSFAFKILISESSLSLNYKGYLNTHETDLPQVI